jgi:alginate O-acetyltransferase complex protein AlgJ
MEERPLTVTPSAILSVCFLIILLLPVAENLVHFAPEIELPEKRRLQSYPAFKWEWKALASYPARFEAAFNDHFGWRGLLVRSQALAKFYWLRISPAPKVILGRDGWLFLESSIKEHRGLQPLPGVRIKQWKTQFAEKRAYLSARGIRYLIVVAPNKETVYPEFLPASVTQIHRRLFMDDLLKALPASAGLDILDLRQPLVQAKNMGRLYIRTDSHWNQLGAAVASDAIIERLSVWFPEFKAQKSGHSFRVLTGKSGDLARLMGLEEHLREEAIVIPGKQRLQPAPLKSRLKMKGLLGNRAIKSVGGKQHLNAIVTGDSFTNTLNMFLPGHFRRTLTIRPLIPFEDPFFQSVVEAEKPDVYIELVVDRHLANPPQVLGPAEENFDAD